MKDELFFYLQIFYLFFQNDDVKFKIFVIFLFGKW